MVMSDKKRKALVALIEDPDERTYIVISHVLRNEGLLVIPLLETVLEQPSATELQVFRAQELLNTIRFDFLEVELSKWLSSPDKDLLQAIIALNKVYDPKLDESFIYQALEKLRKDVWLELNDQQTAFEQVKVLNHVFFNVHSFECTTSVKAELAQFDLAEVLRTKHGSPLVIGLIYSIIANGLSLPIHGIDFPKIFILARMDEHHSAIFANTDSNYGVLFYINPTVNGLVFEESEIHAFLKELDLEPDRKYFEPSSNSELIQRYLSTLMDCSKFNEDMSNQRNFERLLNLFS